jgi:hypothetical protein
MLNLIKKFQQEISVRHEVVGWIPSVELILFHVGAPTISKFGSLEPTKTKCMQAWISLGPNHRFLSLTTPTQAPVPASSLSPTSAGADPGFAMPVHILVSRCWCLFWFRGACAYAGFAVLVRMLVSRWLCWCWRRFRCALALAKRAAPQDVNSDNLHNSTHS